jgi:rhodanese-related sulfurtransferase
VTPDTGLARDAGLALGLKGSILVNDRLETSVPDIYAVGDAVQVQHLVTGADSVISLAGPANTQGRIAADNICSRDSRYHGSLGSSVIKLFDLTAASTGLNETNAKKAGLDADKVYLSPMNHAGYYPGGETMTMKVVFEKGSYRLLGAQIVGFDGVDKRMDVLATAIRFGAKVTDLKDLELCYAPPFGSAKDPVNMVGFTAENVINGTVKQVFWHDVEQLPRDGSVFLLDVRTRSEAARGMIDGAVNIPLDTLRDNLERLPKDRPIYVNCHSGQRSYLACRILAANGFDCYNLAGGWRLYESAVHAKSVQEYVCIRDK